MRDLSAALRDFAAATGIDARAFTSDVNGDGSDGDFRGDVRVDFGRYVERAPACVLRPRSTAELGACLRFLAALGVPHQVRGCAHSAGGQTLSDGGGVVLTSGLDSIGSDDAAGERITVAGGVTWLALFEHLLPQGRRPHVLTDNLRTSIGGTLAVGGFGDASHVYGPQAAGVERLVLVTPDGDAHEATPGAPWFDLALCGGGRLGVIAEVTLKTLRRPASLSGRLLTWTRLDDFVADAIAVAETRRYDFFRARLQWDDGVWAVAGNLRADADDTPPPERVTSPGVLETLDLATVARQDPHARWQFYSPNLELIVPLPSGLTLWRQLRAQLEAWLPFMPRGASVMVLPTASPLPLAPLPKQSAHCLLVALRPELPTAEAARACVPWLRRLAAQALDGGAHIYAASIPIGDARLEALTPAHAQLAAMVATLDPRRLFNRY